jgi:excisionase family DNA binding protein
VAKTLPLVEARLFDIKRAASYLSTSVWQMRQLVWAKQIPNVRLGHKILFDRTDLDKFVEAQKRA